MGAKENAISVISVISVISECLMLAILGLGHLLLMKITGSLLSPPFYRVEGYNSGLISPQ